jgi:hypothetical protein
VRSLRHAKSIEQKAARVLSLASLLKNPLLALTRLFKRLKVFFERLADPLKQSPVFFPFLSRELAVRSVEVRQKFLLRKFHSFFRPPQVFQRFWGWHVGLFGHYVCVTHSTISGGGIRSHPFLLRSHFFPALCLMFVGNPLCFFSAINRAITNISLLCLSSRSLNAVASARSSLRSLPRPAPQRAVVS